MVYTFFVLLRVMFLVLEILLTSVCRWTVSWFLSLFAVSHPSSIFSFLYLLTLWEVMERMAPETLIVNKQKNTHTHNATGRLSSECTSSNDSSKRRHLQTALDAKRGILKSASSFIWRGGGGGCLLIKILFSLHGALIVSLILSLLLLLLLQFYICCEWGRRLKTQWIPCSQVPGCLPHCSLPDNPVVFQTPHERLVIYEMKSNSNSGNFSAPSSEYHACVRVFFVLFSLFFRSGYNRTVFFVP